jgi:hypothetical protein
VWALGTVADGWTRRWAEEELANVLADVRRGDLEAVSAAEHRQGTRGGADVPQVRIRVARAGSARVRGRDGRGLHLGPDPSPAALLRESQAVPRSRIRRSSATGLQGPRARIGLVKRPLTNVTINKTLTRLGQILDVALRYELIDNNPVKTMVQKLKESEPRRARLSGEQIQVLLRA